MTVKINHEFETTTYGQLDGNAQPTTFEARTSGPMPNRYVEITIEGYNGDYMVELNEEDLLTLLDIIKSDQVKREE